MTQNAISWMILAVGVVAVVAIVALPKHMDENGNIKLGKKETEGDDKKEKPAETIAEAVTTV